mmetsp:Transcript_20888/g.48473  ORF Transcript_20888/g.48473 Transcript_20888/m.48473 type:complete len:1207 (-) Transcript_20888:343-3963(-)
MAEEKAQAGASTQASTTAVASGGAVEMGDADEKSVDSLSSESAESGEHCLFGKDGDAEAAAAVEVLKEVRRLSATGLMPGISFSPLMSGKEAAGRRFSDSTPDISRPEYSPDVYPHSITPGHYSREIEGPSPTAVPTADSLATVPTADDSTATTAALPLRANSMSSELSEPTSEEMGPATKVRNEKQRAGSVSKAVKGGAEMRKRSRSSEVRKRSVDSVSVERDDSSGRSISFRGMDDSLSGGVEAQIDQDDQVDVSLSVAEFEADRTKDLKKLYRFVLNSGFLSISVGLFCFALAAVLSTFDDKLISFTFAWIFWLLAPFCLAMGGVIVSTCPLDVIDFDKGSKKDPVLKLVLSGGLFCASLAHGTAPPHLDLLNCIPVLWGGIGGPLIQQIDKTTGEAGGGYRPRVTTLWTSWIFFKGLFCDVASELYKGLMVPDLTTSKQTMHCTGAAINFILVGLATTYWIHQRVLHARTKESRDKGEPMQGINATGGVYLALYSLYLAMGIRNTSNGVWYFVLGDVRRDFQTLYGLVWLIPLAVVLVIGREGLFQYMQTYFDKRHAKSDGAFIAEMLTTEMVCKGDDHWIHRVEPDLKYVFPDHRRYWMKGTVTMVNFQEKYMDVRIDNSSAHAEGGGSSTSPAVLHAFNPSEPVSPTSASTPKGSGGFFGRKRSGSAGSEESPASPAPHNLPPSNGAAATTSGNELEVASSSAVEAVALKSKTEHRTMRTHSLQNHGAGASAATAATRVDDHAGSPGSRAGTGTSLTDLEAGQRATEQTTRTSAQTPQTPPSVQPPNRTRRPSAGSRVTARRRSSLGMLPGLGGGLGTSSLERRPSVTESYLNSTDGEQLANPRRRGSITGLISSGDDGDGAQNPWARLRAIVKSNQVAALMQEEPESPITPFSPGGTSNWGGPKAEVVKVPLDGKITKATELMKLAQSNLRCIDWSNITYELMSQSTGDLVTYRLSRPVRKGEEIDFFMSHSWHDDAKIKWAHLTAFVNDFIHKYGREPTFWLDKVCIDQDNIGDGLKVLPVNVMACKRMLVLCGPSYPTRLWCAWELFTLFSFQAHNAALRRVVLISLSESEAGMEPAEVSGNEKLMNFQVADSHCYDPNEEHKLRSVIAAVGEARFNQSIQKLANDIATSSTRRATIISRTMLTTNMFSFRNMSFHEPDDGGSSRRQLVEKHSRSGSFKLRHQSSLIQPEDNDEEAR